MWFFGVFFQYGRIPERFSEDDSSDHSRICPEHESSRTRIVPENGHFDSAKLGEVRINRHAAAKAKNSR